MKRHLALVLCVVSSAWAADSYDLSYGRLSGGIAWYAGVENPKASDLFDFSKYEPVPEVSRITVAFDTASLRASLSGGGYSTSRYCAAKSKWDLLECEWIPVSEVISPEGCKIERFDQENFGFNKQLGANVFFKVRYHQFTGDCELEKERVLKKIALGTADPFWRALADKGAITLTKLEDLVSLGHLYFTTK